jgi:parvulin-like peptidyl-prolyl isomerase
MQAIWQDAYVNLLQQRIVLQEFKRLGKERGAKIPNDLVDGEVQRFIDDPRRFGGDRVLFNKWLEGNGMTRQKFWQQTRDSIAYREMVGTFVKTPIISPHKVELYYQDHQTEFKVPERVKFRWIVMDKKSDDTNNAVRKRMEEVLILLKAGGDFSELAKSYLDRDIPQRENDWTELPSLNENYRAAMARCKPGENTEVIESSSTYIILHLDEREPTHVAALTELRDTIADKLAAAEINQRREAWIKRLRSRIRVEEAPQ